MRNTFCKLLEAISRRNDAGRAIRLALILLLAQCLISLTGIVQFPYEDFVSPMAGIILGALVTYFYLLHLFCGLFSVRRQLVVAGAGVSLGGLWLSAFLINQTTAVSYWTGSLMVTGGMGIAALVSFLYSLSKKDEGQSAQIRELVGEFGAILLVLMTVPSAGLKLTQALHPYTYDAIVFHFDQALGFQPSVILALIGDRFPPFRNGLLIVYNTLPWGFAVLYALARRNRQKFGLDMLYFWVLSGCVAYVAYHVVPVAGPKYLFNEAFPANMPPPEQVPSVPGLLAPAARNGIPSMHFGWALAYWLTAILFESKLLRHIFAIYLGATVLATLTLGEHYAIDLVVSVPMILALYALCLTRGDDRVRYQTAATGFALTLGWLLFIRFGVTVAQSFPPLVLLAAATTLAACVWAYRRLMVSYYATSATAASLEILSTSTPVVLQLAGVFALSGSAALIYEVVFSKVLALTFGSTALAMYTVLATYMGGIALGSWIGGWLAQRSARPLAAYVVCELAIGIYCVLTPFLFRFTQDLYVSAAAGIPPDAAVLAFLRFGFGAMVLLVPTTLMGLTLPLLVRYLVGRQQQPGRSVAVLYGANTLGASVGALLSGYLILPAVGVQQTALLAAALNLIAAFVVFRMQKQLTQSATAGATEAEPIAAGDAADRTTGWIALAVLGLGGVVTLALETDYIHLLSVVAGNSTYAFSLMLATFLSGLALGGMAAKRLLSSGRPLPVLIAWLEFGLAAMLLLGVFGWEQIPVYLSDYADYPMVRTFSTREFVRGMVCALAMLPPTLFIGAIYPLALQCVGQAFPKKKFAMLGRAMAVNTAGNILGVVLGGFVLLPFVGVLRSIQVLAALSVLLALVALFRATPRHRLVAVAPLSGVVALGLMQPSSFDYGTLASGANVYFRPQQMGSVIDHAESLDGGLTTVAVADGNGRYQIKTLMTNGKFQGNNAMEGEMKAQVGFALAPLLHTAGRERALVIGYGTGVTARTLYDAGFAGLDIAELSSDIVTMANRHFGDINHSVSGLPGVETHITDGRNFMMLQPRQYDVVSIEITSIWFAGAASLYNREFYQLTKKHLKPNGVLQQWVQLHHMRGEDFLTVIATLRSEFRYVWLYLLGGQGVLVAANDAGAFPTADKLNAVGATAQLRPLLDLYGGNAQALSKALFVTPEGIDRLVTEARLPMKYLVSTDDNLRLEYDTPKGNALDNDSSERIVGVLRKVSAAATEARLPMSEKIGVHDSP